MSITATLATAARVLGQLRRDRRTLAMVFLVAPALLALFKYIFNNQPHTFERIGAPMIGLFPLIMMFLITSIAMLRERTSGTLERLMSLPLAKLDLLLGYALAFALLAALQGAITGAVGFGLLNVQARGASWAVVLLAIMNALLGMTLGLFLSAFASTEFQAVPAGRPLSTGSARRPARPARPNAPRARDRLRRSSRHLRLRRARQDHCRQHRHLALARHRHRRRQHHPRAAPRRDHPQTPHRLDKTTSKTMR